MITPDEQQKINELRELYQQVSLRCNELEALGFEIEHDKTRITAWSDLHNTYLHTIRIVRVITEEA